MTTYFKLLRPEQKDTKEREIANFIGNLATKDVPFANFMSRTLIPIQTENMGATKRILRTNSTVVKVDLNHSSSAECCLGRSLDHLRKL